MKNLFDIYASFLMSSGLYIDIAVQQANELINDEYLKNAELMKVEV